MFNLVINYYCVTNADRLPWRGWASSICRWFLGHCRHHYILYRVNRWINCNIHALKMQTDNNCNNINNFNWVACRYSYSFPFLDTKGIVVVDDDRVGPLYEHTFPPSLAPSLSFVGIPRKVNIFNLAHKNLGTSRIANQTVP